MTVKRFIMSGYSIWDSQNDNRRVSTETAYKLLNDLDTENRKLKNELNLSKLNLKEKNEGFDKLHKMYMEQIEENKELKEENQDNQDYISSLEKEKTNLQIKLQKIRDYAMEDGEVKQGVIEKVIFE